MARPKKQNIDAPELTTAQKVGRLRALFFSALQPSEYCDLDDWSDRYRVLPSETSAEHGRWSTARFPFLRTIMKCLSPTSPARSITFVKGAQVGGTEIAICWIMYCADMAPGPMMYAQATEGAAEDFSKQKLAPSISACDRVRYSLGDKKPGRLSNTITDKGFPGGFVVIGPANSEKFTRSKSVRWAIADEEDSYTPDSDGGGAPIKNIQKRQVNFSDRKILRISTPKIKETSTIEPAYEFGSQEQFYIPCPHCNPHAVDGGNRFVIRWDSVRWSKEIDRKTEMPSDVWLECPVCGERIEETAKTWMLEHGEWLSMKDSDTPYRVDEKTENRSFQLSSLYSPFGFFSWRDAVQEWLEYRKTNDRNLLQVFINQTLGESFTLDGQEISSGALEQRCEEYGERYGYDVPRGGLVLTAGVDVQDDRLECEIVAWGLNEESWSVDYIVIPGDTAQLGNHAGILADGHPSVWALLDQYLQRKWRHFSGAEMPVECTMVDAGFRTEQVHTFCRLRESRRMFPLKGRDGWGAGLYQTGKKRHERFHTLLFTAYVDELKAKLFSMLQVTTPGAAFCHFPKSEKYGEKYFRGLTCESRRTKLVNGHPKLVWIKPPGARNEPIDCRNYAYVARLVYPVALEVRARALGLIADVPAVVSAGAARPRRRGSSGL